ncbi:MAG TPA: mechanosensitive ion channel domain-containing protein [Polyangiaceae bacterium]
MDLYLHRIHGVLSVEWLKIGNTPVTLVTIFITVSIVLASLVVSKLVRAAARRAFKRRGIDAQEGGVGVTQRLIHYAILIVGIAVALQTAGIELGALFAAGAVFAVGIGFAMQNIAQNFVSGVILLVERSIKPGDILQVDSRIVKVVKMGIRATLVRTLDEEDLIVPNATLVQSTLKNYTLEDDLYRLRVRVGVDYSADMRIVRELLIQAAQTMEWSDPKYPPRVQMLDFGSSSVDLEVSVWMHDPWQLAPRSSELREAVWWALKGGGVEIAYPQMDVHLDPPLIDSLSKLALRAAPLPS